MGIGDGEGPVNDTPVLHIGGEQAERLLRGGKPGELGLIRQRMSFRNEEAVVLHIERGLQQALDRLVVEIGDAGIDGVIMQCTEDFLRGLGEHGEFDARMIPLHGAGEKRDLGKGRGDDAEHQPADEFALPGADRPQFLLERLPVVQDEMGPFQHPVAFRGEADVTLAALDDGNPELLFELADSA